VIRVSEHIRTIKPYIPGKPIEELERELGIKGSVKLASNENPIGPSPRALKAIKDSLRSLKSSSSLNRYPDGNGYYLKDALAEKLSVKPDEIILGNGSNELIDIAVRTYLGPGYDAVMAQPSFVVYSLSVQSVGGKAIQVPLKDYKHDLDAMANAITPKTRMLFIANPNNPTGTINTDAELDGLMDKIRGDILIVVDEAYYEYVTDAEYADSLKHFKDGKDILILRTFSKIYGLAGLRIGYGIARQDIITEMNKIRAPFNTNSIAQQAAIEALKDNVHVRQSRAINNRGKKYLHKELSSLGIKYIPTEANFIYILMDDNSMTVYEAMLRHGVIVRPVGPQELRVTIGLPEENRRFIKALKKALS